jgi:hypothetical protein
MLVKEALNKMKLKSSVNASMNVGQKQPLANLLVLISIILTKLDDFEEILNCTLMKNRL